jgi:hypothetical protein
MVTKSMIVLAIALAMTQSLAQSGDVIHPAGFVVPTPAGAWTCSLENDAVLCVSSAKPDIRLRFRALDASRSLDESVTLLSTRNDPGVAYAPQGAIQTRSDGIVAVRTVGSAGTRALIGLAGARSLDKVRVGMLGLRIKNQWEPAFDEFALSMLRRIRSCCHRPSTTAGTLGGDNAATGNARPGTESCAQGRAEGGAPPTLANFGNR